MSLSGAQGSDSGAVTVRFGSIRLRLPPRDLFVYYATYVAGEYDRIRLGIGDTVLDAGANVGDYSVLASRKVGKSGLVIAVEPGEESLGYLRKNIELNGCSNIVVVPKALGAGKGRVGLHGSGVTARSESSDLATNWVEATTIDDVMSEAGTRRLDVIKMDIEGAEFEALKGQHALKSVREIGIELHGEEVAERTLSLLREAGFRMRRFTSLDLAARVAENSLRHPIDVVAAEITSRAEAIRGVAATLLGRVPVPSLTSGSGYSLYHGVRDR